jgi:hypothetical protein
MVLRSHVLLASIHSFEAHGACLVHSFEFAFVLMEAIYLTPFDTLPIEVAATLGQALSGGTLPVPAALTMKTASHDDTAHALKRAMPSDTSRELLFRALRLAYLPTTRLRRTCRSLAAASWLLRWDELYDFVMNTLHAWSFEGGWGTMTFHDGNFHFFDDQSLDRLFHYARDDPESKTLAMQYLMHLGSQPYKLVYPKNCGPINTALKELGEEPVARNNSFIYDDVEYALVNRAQRIAAQRADPDDVAFPIVGVQHHKSITGELKLHFLDDMVVHRSETSGCKSLRTNASGPGARANLAMARVYRFDDKGKRVLVPLKEMKRSTLKRWAETLAQQHKQSHGLLTLLRARVKVHTAQAKLRQHEACR